MSENIEEVLEENLTETQKDVAIDESPEIICLACAGSGKSRTMAFRIARLVAEGHSPNSIVAFTFTNKAAESIKHRVSQALAASGFDPTMVGAMYVGTIHSFCGNILQEIDARYQQYDQMDDNRLQMYLMSRYPQLRLNELRYRGGQDRRYFNTISKVANAWKVVNNEMIGLDSVRQHDPLLAEVLTTLRDSLHRDQYYDFSMMIRRTVEALEDGNEDALRVLEPVRHVMCDEYQDVNPAQEALIQQLNQYTDTLFVVGDDDQSIYAWRGADVSNIISFRERYPDAAMYTLSQNFRSTDSIVSAADVFIHGQLGANRVPKNPEARYNRVPRDLRTLHFDDREAEAEWVADRIETLLGTRYEENDGTVRGLTPSDFAILMPSTSQPEQTGDPRHAAFTRQLEERDIPYTLTAGGSIFDRPQVQALRQSFELLENGQPNRQEANDLFTELIRPTYANADFSTFTRVLARWGREIHSPRTSGRRRVYLQQLVHDLLNAFNVSEADFDEGIMQDIGTFSRIMEDVETVYVSIDSAQRFRNVLWFLRHVGESGYNSESDDDILRRPNAVTISTVHRAKGLEFPAVFVSDAQHRRFPRDRSSYDGWLPEPVIQSALNRGAYHGTRDEQARLFYTAVTRAERYLYVTGSRFLPGGTRDNDQSPFAIQLDHEERSYNTDGVPDGLEPEERKRRVEEEGVPTSFSDIRYYLRCPKDFQLRKVYGFSPPIEEMFGFGNTVHAAVGRMHQLFEDGAPTQEQAGEITRDIFHLKHVPQSNDPENNPGPYERARDTAEEIVSDYAQTYGEDFEQRRQIEVRFEIPIEQATISGSIDLLLRVDPDGNILEASVIDFKTMEGGEEPTENPDLDWTALALQVQLYARAAQEVLGENARTGSVHLLKDNQRIEVPVDDDALGAAIGNVEWAVDRILDNEFPMRPSREKCDTCDFKQLCSQRLEEFESESTPPPIHMPGEQEPQMARAFSDLS